MWRHDYPIRRTSGKHGRTPRGESDKFGRKDFKRVWHRHSAGSNVCRRWEVTIDRIVQIKRKTHIHLLSRGTEIWSIMKGQLDASKRATAGWDKLVRPRLITQPRGRSTNVTRSG